MLINQQADNERAIRLLDETLQLFDERGDVRGSARVLTSLGGVASRQGRYGEAERYCQRGLELC